MKRISLILPLFLLVGCGSNQKLNPFSPKQPSIATQKMSAQNAWDELDGKVVTAPKPIKTTHTQTVQKPVSPDITQAAKSMLETADSIPDWFYSPPKSEKYFYGAGEGMNIEEAKAGALNFIAGEINTAVSSEFSKNEGYSNNNGKKDFYKSVKNKVKTEVKKINFTNIEIMKTLKVNNKIYLLVRIDKQKLFNSLKTKFDLLDAQIDNEVKTSQKYSKLDQLITLNKIESKIQKALSLASILNVLNSNFDVKPYAKKYTSYMNKKTELLHEVTFSVSPNDLFGQKLIEILNDKDYKISSNSDIKIKVQKQVRNSTPMGMAVARVTVNIKVISKGKTLKSTSIEAKGIADNKSQALAKASINFKQKINKIGINKLLGFE